VASVLLYTAGLEMSATCRVQVLVLSHRKTSDLLTYLLTRLTTGWTVWGSNPGGGEFSALVQTGPWAHPASCTLGTGSFPVVESDRGVALARHPLPVPRPKNLYSP
jgi:hypothetical protein